MLKHYVKRGAVAAMLTLLPALYFYPALSGQVGLLDGDGWQHALGLRLLVARTLAAGTLPLWNPYTFGGMPLLATTQVGALAPLNWLYALLPPGAAAKALLIVCFYLALIGAYLYARSIKINRVSALVTGIVFAFGGFLVAQIEHDVIIAAAVWLPWLLLAIERLYERVRWRWVVLGALLLALQLMAGHPQPAFYSLLLAGAYAVFTVFLRAQSGERWRLLGALTMMAACGLLLAAAQWLPTLELLRQADRAQISYEFFSSFAMPPRRLLALVFPFFFGGHGVPPYRISFWDSWWESKWVCGYVGMLGLLLALVALSGARRQRLVWFWAVTAVVALALAMGPHLPFGLNHLLYRVPGLNLFRCSYRHLNEFSLALATLAGLGVNTLAGMERAARLRTVRNAALALTALVAVVTVIYCFYVGSVGTPPAQVGSLTNAEAYVPLIFLGLSIAALWHYARRGTTLAGAALVAVLLFDLGSFGHAFYWRRLNPHLVDQLADPPTVAYIKARESDLKAFRVMSQSQGAEPILLNSPNVSIARGLQLVNGYDPIVLPRLAALAGQMTMFGVPQDLNIYTPTDQSLNLLNAKYLLYERSRIGLEHDGIGFSPFDLGLQLAPGARAEITTPGTPATELALVSLMSNAGHLADGAPVAQIRLHTNDGRVIEREVQAGRDTAEWAYDRADVRASIRHQRPRTVESADAGGFQAHRYLARLPFERAEIVRVEFNYVPVDASLHIMRASLFDAQTGVATPLDRPALPPERWRKLTSFGAVGVYENLKALPRAWFVPRMAVRPRAEVLRIIKEGKLEDGTPFDPTELALLQAEDQEPSASAGAGERANAQVSITSYESQRIELTVRNQQAGWLVLSEVYYPGWEAQVDGTPTRIHRTNYALRGIAVPPGDHRVVFNYRAPPFRRGLICAAVGLALLLAGAFIGRGARPALSNSSEIQ